MKLRTIAQHNADRVTGFHAQRRQASGDLPHVIGVLAPRDHHFAADRPDGDIVGFQGRGLLESLGQCAHHDAAWVPNYCGVAFGHFVPPFGYCQCLSVAA
jgi:hypothetical protein